MRSDATCIVMKAVILEQLKEEENERTAMMWDGRNFLSGDESHWFCPYGREREGRMEGRDNRKMAVNARVKRVEGKNKYRNDNETVVKNMETVQQRGNKLNDVREREE